MRLALAQINPTVGDLPGNAALVCRFIDQAREQNADIAVFPELALCGYPPKDLLLQEGFVAECVKHAKDIGENHSDGLTVVFGCPLPVDPADVSKRGSGIANSLLVYRDGAYVAYYDKRLLPTYDVFDEDRYFVPGERSVVIDVPCREGQTRRVGLSICEDLWRGEDVGFSSRYTSKPDPVTELCAVQPDGSPGAEIIVNPSASPCLLGKGARHRALLRGHATRHSVIVAAVNQVGGNDELIFDGHACVFSSTGELIAAAKGFEEQLLVIDLPAREQASGAPTASSVAPTPPLSVIDPMLSSEREELLFRSLVLGARDYCRKTGFKTAVLGLSGGIDSAVVAVLGAAALGPSKVLGVSLPSRYSSEGSRTDAHELAKRLNIECSTIGIEGPFAAMLDALNASMNGATEGVTAENLQSRCRGTLLMALSNRFGHLLLTTGNKTELAVGYCTLYGDMNGGLAVISDVPKMQVYALARWINAHWRELGIAGLQGPPIPNASITKPPSAELRPNQTDQDSLPPYEVLDDIVHRYVELRQHPKRIVDEGGHAPAVVARVVKLIHISEFKRKQAAIGLKVTGVAFGSGRRMPIAQRYRPESGIA
jgi:NAD+ synthetase